MYCINVLANYWQQVIVHFTVKQVTQHYAASLEDPIALTEKREYFIHW